MWGALRSNLATNVGGFVDSALKFAEGLEKDLDTALGANPAAPAGAPQSLEDKAAAPKHESHLAQQSHQDQGGSEAYTRGDRGDAADVLPIAASVTATLSYDHVYATEAGKQRDAAGTTEEGGASEHDTAVPIPERSGTEEKDRNFFPRHAICTGEQQAYEEDGPRFENDKDVGSDPLSDGAASSTIASETSMSVGITHELELGDETAEQGISQWENRSGKPSNEYNIESTNVNHAQHRPPAQAMLEEGEDGSWLPTAHVMDFVDAREMENPTTVTGEGTACKSDGKCAHVLDVEELTLKLSEMQRVLTNAWAELTTKDATIKSLVDSRNECLITIEDMKAALKSQAKAHGDEIQKLRDELTVTHDDFSEHLQAQDALRLTELAALRKLLEAAQAESNDLKKSLTEQRARMLQLQDELHESQVKLRGFEEEGRQLSIKQSEMEKAVRKSRTELREKEAELKRLTESRSEGLLTIDVLNERLRSSEAAKADEQANQRKALEAAWAESNEYKRQVSDLKQALVTLQQQLGERLQKAEASELTVRDSEQRETALRAANQQLQESLQRQMEEANVREEVLVKELHDMRRRWREAVSRADLLEKDMSVANAPLLAQITKLQETLQAKMEHFQSLEASLLERTLKAERHAQAAESNELKALEHLKSSRAALEAAEDAGRTQAAQIHVLESKLKTALSTISDAQKTISAMSEEMEGMKANLEVAAEGERQLQLQLKRKEMRLKMEMEEIRELEFQKAKQAEAQIAELEARLKAMQSSPPSLSHKSSDVLSMDSTDLPSGEVSFVVLDRMQQMFRAKEEDASSLRHQLQQAEVGRQALAEEVAYLNSKNLALEEAASDGDTMREQVRTLERDKILLLEMVGEKNDQLNALQQDMEEVKNMYRTELRELMDRLAPPT